MDLQKLLCATLAAVTFAFGGVINLSVEPMWSSEGSFVYERNPNRRVMWGLAGQFGWTPNEYISFGPSLSASWSVESEKEAIAETPGTHQVLSRESVMQLPLSFVVMVDPIPQYMIHPIAHLALGYNSVWMINNVNRSESQDVKDEIKKYDGYYSGLYVKFGADVMIDLGQKISLFAGPQWQISTVQRRSISHDGPPQERKFNAFGLRFGVSALL